jgi:ADP-heptose:LPS heptosyltransferase
MSRKFTVPKEKQMVLNLMLNSGGLGDILHCIPALNNIFKNYPYQKYKIWVPDYLVPFFQKAYPDKSVGPFSKAPSGADGKRTGILAFNISRHSSIHTHLTDYANYILTDMMPMDDEPREMPYFNFNTNIKDFKLKEPYICLSPFFRNNLREMPVPTMGKISEFAKNRGLKLVLLGSKGNVYNAKTGLKTTGFGEHGLTGDHVIDLTNKTHILAALQIIWGAKAMVTMDGGLFHLAALTKTPIIAGFTSVDPKTRIPYRSGKLDPSIKIVAPEVDCRFCQTNWCMVYNGQHEFDKCFFKDRQCVKEMTADKFLTYLEEVI